MSFAERELTAPVNHFFAVPYPITTVSSRLYDSSSITTWNCILFATNISFVLYPIAEKVRTDLSEATFMLNSPSILLTVPFWYLSQGLLLLSFGRIGRKK